MKIVDATVSMIASSAVDCGFKPGQTKDYNIYICCFSTKSKSKHWLTQNQSNESEWSDVSNRELLFQCASTIKILLSLLV